MAHRPRLLRGYVYLAPPRPSSERMENFVPSESEAFRNLHQLAHAAMFEETTWPANPARCDAIERMMLNSGLLKESAGEAALTYTYPHLFVDVELLLACSGAVGPHTIQFLEEYGYASEEEVLEVSQARTEPECLQLLQSLIFRAYNERFVRSNSTH